MWSSKILYERNFLVYKSAIECTFDAISVQLSVHFEYSYDMSDISVKT